MKSFDLYFSNPYSYIGIFGIRRYLMEKRILLAIIVALAVLFSSTSFAYMNVTNNYTDLWSQSNLSSNVTMLKLTFNLSDNTTVNITRINFTFGSTNATLIANANLANLTVCVYDSLVNQSNMTGCNGTWSGNVTSVLVGRNVTNSTNLILFVVYRINMTGVPYPTSVNISITSNSSIENDNASIYINNTFPISSSNTEIRIVRAYASITPSFVDTNVTNQTFMYNILNLSNDSFEKLKITVPGGFALVNVINWSYVKSDTTTTSGTGCSTNCSMVGNEINISDVVGIRNVTIYFNANTNASALNSIAFNSTIEGTNVANISTTTIASSTNVTTKPLISIVNISAIKNSAFINGTDYWEFNFTLNITDAAIGMVQLKMGNWNSTALGTNLSLQNGTSGNITYYATLRGATDFATTNKCNLTNDYNASQGVYINSTGAVLYSAVLRMVIPLGTLPTNDWWTTYKILFRTQP